MKSHGKSKAVIAAVIFEVNLLQSSRFGEAKSWKQRPAGELGLCSMVNVSKSLLNVVSGNQAKVADRPEPKGVQSDVLL